MNTTKQLLLIILFCSASQFLLAKQSLNQPPLLSGSPPIFPAALASGGINNGFAILACTIDDNGKVIETWTLSSSKNAFATASEKALKDWIYIDSNDGHDTIPWPRVDLIRFEFTREGQITTKNHLEAIRSSFPVARNIDYKVYDLPLLPPQGIVRVTGSLPSPPENSGSGDVIVEFLVDSQGVAHLPVAIAAENKVLAQAAVEAVRDWVIYLPNPSFADPAARVRWTFRFP